MAVAETDPAPQAADITDPFAGLTEEQRQHLAALASDPALRARFNGSSARIAVRDVPSRAGFNKEFGLSIAAADLARALGISEEDMLAIEAGTKATDDAGWTEIMTALFALGSGMNPEHIADPASGPAFQRAMENEDAPLESVHYATKGDPVVYPTACGMIWKQDARFRWTDNADDVQGCTTCENASKTDRPWHRDRAVVVRASNRLNEEVAREAAKATETLLRKTHPVPARGRGDIRANTAWIREHGAPYRGQWVALRDGALVRANKNRSVLFDSLEQSGDLDVLLVKIDKDALDRGR
jgi:hypothetical protein